MSNNNEIGATNIDVFKVNSNLNRHVSRYEYERSRIEFQIKKLLSSSDKHSAQLTQVSVNQNRLSDYQKKISLEMRGDIAEIKKDLESYQILGVNLTSTIHGKDSQGGLIGDFRAMSAKLDELPKNSTFMTFFGIMLAGMLALGGIILTQ